MIADLPESSRYLPLTGLQPALVADRTLVLFNGEVVFNSGGSWLWNANELSELPLTSSIVIGYLNQSATAIAELETLPEGKETITVRHLLSVTGETTFSLLSHGLQILSSRKEHQSCGYCGSRNEPEAGEWAMVCRSCGHHAYPRISPCIIVLVKRGEEYLLVRHTRHGKVSTMHTLVAGFVEPGESAEEAVKREVMEETGIEVDSFKYCMSQSWPFPHSLMLGFHAEYKSGDLKIDNDELCFAGWFHQNELPELPPEFTISRKVIDFNE